MLHAPFHGTFLGGEVSSTFARFESWFRWTCGSACGFSSKWGDGSKAHNFAPLVKMLRGVMKEIHIRDVFLPADLSFHYLQVSLSVPEFWGQCLCACHACRQAAVTQLKRALSEYPPAFLPVLWQSSLNLLNGRHRKSGTVILPPLNLRLILESVKYSFTLSFHLCHRLPF